ncbi:MAG: hypothetical protein Q9172_004042 [Xanthocarpia lactea]
MADHESDVLRIYPSNTEAKKAFHSLARLKNVKSELKGMHEDHLKYVEVTGISKKDESCARDNEETPDEYTDTDDPGKEGHTELYEGFFGVHFDLPLVSNHLRWVIGRGSALKFGEHRSVDILLAAPGSAHTQKASTAHVFLSMHQSSGAWLLAAGAPMKVDDESLARGDKICLFRPKTHIRLLNLQYVVEFVVNTPELEQRYLEARRSLFESREMSIPATGIPGIPSRSDIVCGDVVFRHPLGMGTFGEVFEAIDQKTGDLRVVKRIVCKKPEAAIAAEDEIEALLRFSNCIGILNLLDWRTIQGDRSLEWKGQHIDIYLVHKKGISFDRHYWITQTSPDWALRRSLCHQLLAGLKTIHAALYMHRDITPQNIILFDNGQQSEAALCDFGKVCNQPSHDDTCLAAWTFLPPELEKGRKRIYNQSLDIWMLAFALTLSWFPHTRQLSQSSHQITHPKFNLLQSHLRQQETQSAGLSHLLGQMLSWDPNRRPTAATASNHWCFNGIITSEPPEKTSASKRPHQSDSSDT